MSISLKKESYTTGKVDWNYSIFHDDVSIGYCLVEVMDGNKEDVLKRYDAEEEHNCYDILKRISEIDPSKLVHKIAFIRLIEIHENFQQQGFGRTSLSLILEELQQNGYDYAILDAFKGGFLIPFYESFDFERIPFPKEIEEKKRTIHNGENFMWKKFSH